MSKKRKPLDEVSGWAEATSAGAPPSANGSEFDIEAFLAAHLSVRRGPLAWGDGGRKWELEMCPFNPEHIGGCAVVTQSATGIPGFKCQHNSCKEKHWRDVRELFDGKPGTERIAKPGKPTIQLPATISGTDLFNRQAVDVPILLKAEARPIMGDGLCLFAATQKAGKSWIALQISIAIAGGPPFEGLEIVEGGPVLYGALEEPAARTTGRLRKLAPNGGDWLNELHFFYDLLPLMGGGAEQLAGMIEAIRPRFVVLDTLTALVKASKGSNSDVFRSQYAEVARIRQLAEAHHVGILMPHHTRKGVGDGVIESIAGTGGISAAVDTVWRLKRNPEGGAVLEVVGREVEECSFGMHFERETPFGWRFEADGLRSAVTAERREILVLLQDGGAMTPVQISVELGKSRSAVRAMLKRMVSDGLVRKQGTKYTPTLSKSNSSNRESKDEENQ